MSEYTQEEKWRKMHSSKLCEVCGEESDFLRNGRWLCEAHVNDPGVPVGNDDPGS